MLLKEVVVVVEVKETVVKSDGGGESLVFFQSRGSDRLLRRRCT